MIYMYISYHLSTINSIDNYYTTIEFSSPNLHLNNKMLIQYQFKLVPFKNKGLKVCGKLHSGERPWCPT